MTLPINLAELERLAKGLQNMKACGFPTPAEPALIRSLISQLRAAMEALKVARKYVCVTDHEGQDEATLRETYPEAGVIVDRDLAIIDAAIAGETK